MDRIAAIERRLQELEDERAIREVLARYSFNTDLGREREYVELFTEDGAIDLSDMGLPRFEGGEQLTAFIGGDDARRVQLRSQHHAATNVIHVNGDDAIAEGYSILVLRNDDGTFCIPHANFSQWTFRREHGEWKIVEREIKLLGSPDAPSLFTNTTR